ncbi:Uncharacterised protein [Alistipes sp. cv1]|nr:Uncharacterised protein [Faecalibacterium prausnitzii]
MATLPTTLEPTKGTILRMARECNRHVELVDCLVDGAFGLDQDQFKARMTEMAGTIADKVDVIVFAQGSMARAEKGAGKERHHLKKEQEPEHENGSGEDIFLKENSYEKDDFPS